MSPSGNDDGKRGKSKSPPELIGQGPPKRRALPAVSSPRSAAALPAPAAVKINGPTKSSPNTGAAATVPTNKLSFDDVNLPSENVPAPITPPEHFSAIFRGVLRIESDGTHTCAGGRASTEELLEKEWTSRCQFGIEAHEAAEDARMMLKSLKSSGLDKDDDRNATDGINTSPLANSTFPVDSTRYRGGFKLKKGAAVMDQQLVLKYVKNSGGSYNVYGKGTNKLGIFDIVGTLTLQSKSRGLMQLYRTYVYGQHGSGGRANGRTELTPKTRASSSAPTNFYLSANVPAGSSNSPAQKAAQPFGRGKSIKSLDAKLAASLQAMEDRLAGENAAMLSTSEGKAYKFTEMVVNECARIKKDILSQEFDIEPVANDDMVHQAEALLSCQKMFINRGKDSHVDIGFHFTNKERLETIQQGGLMTRKDLVSSSKLCSQERVGSHGSSFGDGVYTGNDLCVFKRYGDVGLMVARLKGNIRRVKPKEVYLGGTLEKPTLHVKDETLLGNKAILSGFDTIIGNKRIAAQPRRELWDEVVLLRSNQCIPLVRFPASLVEERSHGTIPDALKPWMGTLKEVVDDFFNQNGSPAAISPAKNYGTEPHPQVSSGPAVNATGTVRASIPASTFGQRKQAPVQQQIMVIPYIAPDSLSDTSLVEKPNLTPAARAALANEMCTICQDMLATSTNLLRVKMCQHMFCEECILRSLSIHGRKCPTCQTLVGDPQGKSPSGKMTVFTRQDVSCAGYSNVGSIWIEYVLGSGIQKKYHEEEGKAYNGIRRRAYLPDNDDGQRLLNRLTFAFRHGLTFCIGKSLTTYKPGVITWASIHHKTSLQGGTHGWPDATFILRCNKELDDLGVPKANECK